MNGSMIPKAICKKLHKAYPAIPIYREHIAEGFTRPCFFVWTSGVEHNDEIHGRFHQLYTMEISYFTGRGDENAYCNIVDRASELFVLLDSIELEVGNAVMPVWGSDKVRQIEDDDTMQISIKYRIEGYVDEPESVLMQSLDLNTDGE